MSELVALLERLGSVPSEGADGFSELDHALQCAHALVLERPGDIGLQLAGLVHDVGHQFGPDDRHDVLGAEAVRPLLGARVADLVAAHVLAKRYLATTHPSYQEQLSVESRHTLVAQGGAMTDADVVAFKRLPHFDDAIRLRLADDAAKVMGRGVPGLDQWVPILRDLSGSAG